MLQMSEHNGTMRSQYIGKHSGLPVRGPTGIVPGGEAIFSLPNTSLFRQFISDVIRAYAMALKTQPPNRVHVQDASTDLWYWYHFTQLYQVSHDIFVACFLSRAPSRPVSGCQEKLSRKSPRRIATLRGHHGGCGGQRSGPIAPLRAA